jgi:D-glycerate 3-kinase
MQRPSLPGTRRVTASLDLSLQAIEGWLSNSKRPLVVGICGAQGSGKSTLARHLGEELEDAGRRVAILSLDDLYLPRNARQNLADTVHPMFATRGVPGTHDVNLGLRVLDALRAGQPVHLPRFDKGADNPLPENDWPLVEAADVILFEGWCVGARPQAPADLVQPINDLEIDRDPDGIWRRAVNDALAGPYQDLFGRLDRLILLAAPDFHTVQDWRTQQEHGLRERLKREGKVGTRVMSDAEIAVFIRFYERLTRHILKEMPPRADLTLWLDAGRRVIESKTA